MMEGTGDNNETSATELKTQEEEGNDIGLVIVTPRRDDFERVRAWADTIEKVSP